MDRVITPLAALLAPCDMICTNQHLQAPLPWASYVLGAIFLAVALAWFSGAVYLMGHEVRVLVKRHEDKEDREGKE